MYYYIFNIVVFINNGTKEYGMLNFVKISGMILNSKRCPLCKKPLTETHLKEQKYTCRVTCTTCKITHDSYHFYDCYDMFINTVTNILRTKFYKSKRTYLSA